MRRTGGSRAARCAAALAACALAACASSAGGGAVPLCPDLAALPPLPAAAACDEHELHGYTQELSERVAGHASHSIVRVAFDDDARVRSVCVDRRFVTDVSKASQGLGPQLAAILAHPPGPACLAGKRIDLNRYAAALAEMDRTRDRCARRVYPAQPGPRYPRRQEFHLGSDPAGDGDVEPIRDREMSRCLERAEQWIVLPVPGSTDPWIFAKPEIPDPRGPRAKETTLRCSELAGGLEAQVECIERDGWERLTPR